jgi:hypothetical protein
MIWSAVALRRIPVARQGNLRPEFLGAGYRRIKVLHFKPQQHSIPMSHSWIPDGAVMMTNMPAMQLHEQLAVRNQLFVLASTLAALASQKTLVPATAGFNISNTNQGLWTHSQFHSNSTPAHPRIHRQWSRRACFLLCSVQEAAGCREHASVR